MKEWLPALVSVFCAGITVGTISSICNALGLDFIEVLKQAEHTRPALAGDKEA